MYKAIIILSVALLISIGVVFQVNRNIKDYTELNRTYLIKIDSLKNALEATKKKIPVIDDYNRGVVVEKGICGEFTVEFGQPGMGFYQLGYKENQIKLIDQGFINFEIGQVVYLSLEIKN